MEAKTVWVELVWPAERGEKNDCKGHTNVVWSGNGDIQEYPAALWPKLEGHPDVWRLVDQPKMRARSSRAMNLEEAAEAERLREEAEARRLIDENAGKNKHTVVVSSLLHPYTAEELATMKHEDIFAEAGKRSYGLNPRLKLENLIVKFLEAQSEDMEADLAEYEEQPDDEA